MNLNLYGSNYERQAFLFSCSHVAHTLSKLHFIACKALGDAWVQSGEMGDYLH
jgi:hypothetical protein